VLLDISMPRLQASTRSGDARAPPDCRIVALSGTRPRDGAAALARGRTRTSRRAPAGAIRDAIAVPGPRRPRETRA
jgi:hypothetical protein